MVTYPYENLEIGRSCAVTDGPTDEGRGGVHALSWMTALPHSFVSCHRDDTLL